MWQNLSAVLHTLVSAISAALLTIAGICAGLPRSSGTTALQSTAAVELRLTSRVAVSVPANDAELAVNGETIPGDGRPGSSRRACSRRAAFIVIPLP